MTAWAGLLLTAIDWIFENGCRYIAGYSIGETARMLRITPAQVRWRLERAKKQLRAQLGDKEEII